MRRGTGVALAIVAIAVGVALAWSGTLDPRPRFEALSSSGAGFAAVPAVLRDGTGLVTGVRPPLEPNFDAGLGSLQNPDGEPASLALDWIGGACDDKVDIAFERFEDGYLLGLHTDRGFDVGCPAVGIARGIVIELSSDVDAGDVTLVVR